MSARQPDPQQQQPDLPEGEPRLAPARTDTVRIVLVGTTCWLVALVVTLLVPELRTGERDWWPWACVTGLVLGLLGLLPARRR